MLDATGGDDAAVARLVETIGLTADSDPSDILERLAAETGRGLLTRVAAVAALGDWGRGHDVLVSLTVRDDELASHATLPLQDQWQRARPPSGLTDSRGIRVGQVFVHADFTSTARSGAGEHGGIATLLTLIAGELAHQHGVEDVVTIGGGGVVEALLTGWPTAAAGAGAVPFGSGDGVAVWDAWPYRVQIERGVRRVLRAVGRLDVLHLRMADVGSLAAARVARRAGAPIVFTAAPDPHSTVDALARSGALTRANFGDSDASEHWWFRIRMVERLGAQADHVVMLPRPGGRDAVAQLIGTELAPTASSVVPEGVHAATVRRARLAVSSRPVDALGLVVADLLRALSHLPRRRRRLPLVITVGRLHPVKGMTRVADAWKATMADSTNLVVVGGDLVNPSTDERDVLDHLRTVAGQQRGLILLGRRDHADVATLLHVAAGHSRPPFPTGVYVAGSHKEEFGLAIVEALAAGLPVVAPAAGGPSTYVRDGVDGILVRDGTVDALGAAMRRAFALRNVPGRAAAATARILDELTIEAMAGALADIYVDVAAQRAATS